jgi:hypothetical protein
MATRRILKNKNRMGNVYNKYNTLHQKRTMEILADVFKKDCMKRLKLLEEVNFIFNSSETINKALDLVFRHSSLYPDSIDQIRGIQAEIQQLENCINATEVSFLRLKYKLSQCSHTSPNHTGKLATRKQDMHRELRTPSTRPVLHVLPRNLLLVRVQDAPLFWTPQATLLQHAHTRRDS